MSRYSRWGFFKNRDVGSANIFVPYVSVTSTVSNVNSTVTYNIDTNYSNTEFTYDLIVSNNTGQFESISNLDFTDGIVSANIIMDADGNATVTKDLEILNRLDSANLFAITGELKFRLKYGDRILADDWADDTRVIIDIKDGMDASGGYEIQGGRSIDMIPRWPADQASNAELSNIDIITENNYYAFKTHAFYETDSANSNQSLVINYIGDDPNELITNITLSNTYSTTVANVTYDYDFMTLDCVTVAVGRGANGAYDLTGNPSPDDYKFGNGGGGGVSRSFTGFNEWETKTYTVQISDGSWTNNDYAGFSDMYSPVGAYNSFIFPLGNSGVSYSNISSVGNGGVGGWIYAMAGITGFFGGARGGESMEWGHCNISVADPGLSPDGNLSLPRPFSIGIGYLDKGPYTANSIISEQFKPGVLNHPTRPGGRGRLSSSTDNGQGGFNARTFSIYNKQPDGLGGFTAEYSAWPSELLEGFSVGGVVVNGNVSPTQKTFGSGVVQHGAGGNSGYVLDANVPGRDIPAPISTQPGANGVVLVRYISKYRKLRKFINP